MFQLKYQNEWLDLAPKQSLEIERNNPMFMLDNLFGEKTTSITLPATEKNVRLIGKLFFDLSSKRKLEIEVEAYDNYTFAFQCTLVLNKSVTNRRYPEKSTASGHLRLGITRLYNDLKNVKANTLNLSRTIAFTSWDPADGSNGYWQKFHASWNNTEDYIIAPVQDSNWYGMDIDPSFFSGIINRMNNTGQLEQMQPLVIFPRASYVFKKIFELNGWTIDTTAMDATGWNDLFLFSVKPFEYWTIGFSVMPMSSINLNPAEFLSPELSCFDVFYELCRKYGWVPNIDLSSNHCTLVPLKAGLTGGTKDFTRYASARVDNDFESVERSFSIKQTMTGEDDAYGSAPDLDGLTIANDLESFDDLPDPTTGGYDRTVIFVYRENKYYQVIWDEVLNERVWSVLADNIYDDEVEGSTDSFESKVTTLPVYKVKHRSNAGTDYYAYLPYSKQSMSKNWGLRTLLFNGMVNELLEDGSAGPNQYPQLSCIRVMHEGTETNEFSNVITHTNPATNEDLGIREYWFREWINLIKGPEINEQRIYLPLKELRQLKWNDKILLFNIPYVMMSYIEPRPYKKPKNFIMAKLKRLHVGNAADDVAAGPTIYVKLFVTDPGTRADYSYAHWAGGNVYHTDIHDALVVAKFFSDAAGTIPAAVTNLTVKWNMHVDVNGNPVSDIPQNIVANGTESNYQDFISQVFGPKSVTAQNIDASTVPSPYTEPAADYEYTYSILPSPDYTIIP